MNYLSATQVLEKNFFFEGTVSIPDESDRDEADGILRERIGKIESAASPRTKLENTGFTEATTLLSDWLPEVVHRSPQR